MMGSHSVKSLGFKILRFAQDDKKTMKLVPMEWQFDFPHRFARGMAPATGRSF